MKTAMQENPSTVNKVRTLEERLKFDLGLTVETLHAVRFRRGEDEQVALVYIPRRGYPRVIVRKGTFIITSRVKGDLMKTVGVQTTQQYGEEFDQKTTAPTVTVNLVVSPEIG